MSGDRGAGASIARRRCVLAMAAYAAWLPMHTRGQGRPRVARVGWIESGSSEHPEVVLDVMRAFRALGYREGEIEFQALFAEGRRERLDGIAADLVAMKPDVIFAGATSGTLAVQRATRAIPIVFAGVSDPVGAGFVKTLARPGGNITGISNFGVDTASKPLELLRELLPKARRIGVLASGNPGMVPVVEATRTAATQLGIDVRVESADDLAQIETSLASFRQAGLDGLVVLSDTPTISNRKRLAELAAAARLPTIYSYALHVESGGLMSYGPDPVGLIPQVVWYIDRILKGARPGDLAVQGPRDFELALNHDAARALGITFSRELVLRAKTIVGKP